MVVYGQFGSVSQHFSQRVGRFAGSELHEPIAPEPMHEDIAYSVEDLGRCSRAVQLLYGD